MKKIPDSEIDKHRQRYCQTYRQRYRPSNTINLNNSNAEIIQIYQLTLDLYAFIGFIGFIGPDDVNYMC